MNNLPAMRADFVGSFLRPEAVKKARLQFDDCTWGMLVDPAALWMWGTDEAGLKAIQEMNLRINNMAIEGKPADMFINTHVCRGNYHSTYANEGAYDKVAEVLFERENVNAYFLEFDDARSGGFEPLGQDVGMGKTVCRDWGGLLDGV